MLVVVAPSFPLILFLSLSSIIIAGATLVFVSDVIWKYENFWNYKNRNERTVGLLTGYIIWPHSTYYMDRNSLYR